jgi:hypothetical protein
VSALLRFAVSKACHCPVAQQLTGILVERSLKRARIDFGADLARLDLRVVVAKELLDDDGDIAPDDDVSMGLMVPVAVTERAMVPRVIGAVV